MLAELWYSANWGLVLAGLIAGVAASVFSRRLSLLWHGASMFAIGLYLGICVIIFLEALPPGRGLTAAGLQLAVGLGILGASLCRLHLVGVAIYAAGGVVSVLIHAVSDGPLLAQEPPFVVLDTVAVGFLIILGRFVVREWRHFASTLCLAQARRVGKSSRPEQEKIAT
ncbi:MAG: hypothetical protein ACK4FJ_02585 [Ferrovibrio sp.]|uniref:hypothetical protein n=1 Tax=Ferrovibrio sp. TaxID=1917215 RepID=UPI00391880E8